MNDWRSELREIIQNSRPTLGCAVLNFLPAIENFAGYSESFRDAARSLVREFSQKTFYSDYEVCPILFLYRHSCELLMKAIIIDGSRVLNADGKESTFSVNQHLKCHGLKQLISAVRTVGTHVGWNPHDLARVSEWPASFDELLDTVDGMDPGSYTYRYPVKTNGEASVEPHHHVSVFEYAQIAESLLEGFEELNGRVMGAWDAISEARDSMLDW